MLQLTRTEIEGLVVLEPKVFGDDRGYFMETYNKKDLEQLDLHYDFVQDNQSKSGKGVLRGLHYQVHHQQAKLVRVIEGKVYDVAVDLREGSPTHGKWFGVLLSGENKKMLLIPKGFAHGFLVISDMAVFTYKCDDFYHPEDEGGIIYNDPSLGISWPDVGDILLSDKDKKHPRMSDRRILL